MEVQLPRAGPGGRAKRTGWRPGGQLRGLTAKRQELVGRVVPGPVMACGCPVYHGKELKTTTSGQLNILPMRVPGEGRALRPPTLGWLVRVWIELEELLCDFSLKPFVGPNPTPQSHHGWCSSADGLSTVLVLRGDIARPMTGHNE